MRPQLGSKINIECPHCGEGQYVTVMPGIRQMRCWFCASVIRLTFDQAINGEVIVNSELVRKGMDPL